ASASLKALEPDDDDVVTLLSDVLEDLGVDNARLLLAPNPDNGIVRDAIIVDAEDEDGVQPGTLVMLIGARGRAALPAIRRI
ncbi:hypothetical protein SCA31_24840, partial [Chryseobacterium sp. SIMBA_028]